MKGPYVASDLRSGNGRKTGFTIIEIMLVVGIIALLVSMAVPYFVAYRASAQAKTCVANLRQLAAAKEQWALEEKKASGAACDVTNIAGPDKHIKNVVLCPAGGGAPYEVGVVGDSPACPTTIPEHVLP